MAKTDRYLSTLYAVLGVVFPIYLVFVLYRYGGLGIYLDHAEPSVAVRSWRLVAGDTLFDPASSDRYMITAYGPLLYLLNAFHLALFGGSIAASKLAGLVSAAASVAVFAAYVRREFGARYLGIGVLVFTCFLLLSAPVSFWTRPDPHSILLVTLALLATTFGGGEGRRWTVPLAIAVLVGLAVNLKAHSFIYFVPLVIRHCRYRWYLTWPLMGVLAVGVFLVPFAAPGISLENYLRGVFGVVAARDIIPSLFMTGLKYSLLFVTPGLGLAALLIHRRRDLPWAEIAYFGTLFLGVALNLYPSSVAGASWSHLLPFFPLTVDLILRFLRLLEERPVSYRSLQLLFAVGFVIMTVTPQKRLLRAYESFSWAPAVAAEVEEIIGLYPSMTMEMGYGEDVAVTYKRTYLRPLLAFAGNPTTISGSSAMELMWRRQPPHPGKLRRLGECATDLWLIPKGERPFRMQNYFTGEAAFWPQFVAAFDDNHERTRSFEYFDLWTCNAKER